VVATPVGDRYVVEEMVRGGFNVGGEQSGHVVFLDHNTTGDGLVTALALLAILVEKGRPLSELRRVMQRLPQVLVNVRVAQRVDVARVPALRDAVARAETTLGERGRVLVRYSGTEPLLRIMVEGEREGQIRELADGIADAARAALGEAAPVAVGRR
jgi:phosphoglucosamine mutase